MLSESQHRNSSTFRRQLQTVLLLTNAALLNAYHFNVTFNMVEHTLDKLVPLTSSVITAINIHSIANVSFSFFMMLIKQNNVSPRNWEPLV